MTGGASKATCWASDSTAALEMVLSISAPNRTRGLARLTFASNAFFIVFSPDC